MAEWLLLFISRYVIMMTCGFDSCTDSAYVCVKVVFPGAPVVPIGTVIVKVKES